MLPLLLAAAPAVATGISTAYNAYSKRKELNRKYRQMKRLKPYEQTEEGALLKRVGAEGAIGPEARARIMGRVGAETGAVAAQGKAGLAARSRRRLGVAFASDANQFDMERMNVMGQKAGEIEQANEESRLEAQQRYASGADAYAAARRARYDQLDQKRDQWGRDLVGGVLNTGLQAAQGYMGYKAGALAGEDRELARRFKEAQIGKLIAETGRELLPPPESLSRRLRGIQNEAEAQTVILDNAKDSDKAQDYFEWWFRNVMNPSGEFEKLPAFKPRRLKIGRF